VYQPEKKFPSFRYLLLCHRERDTHTHRKRDKDREIVTCVGIQNQEGIEWCN
jgi:hypothetical protein